MLWCRFEHSQDMTFFDCSPRPTLHNLCNACFYSWLLLPSFLPPLFFSGLPPQPWASFLLTLGPLPPTSPCYSSLQLCPWALALPSLFPSPSVFESYTIWAGRVGQSWAGSGQEVCEMAWTLNRCPVCVGCKHKVCSDMLVWTDMLENVNIIYMP